MKLVTAGKEVIMCNDLVAHSHFVSKTRQLFETEKGSFVYKMDENLIYRLKSTESYTRLLLKLLKQEENIIYNNKLTHIKNV
jgi:hypothetical protein